MTLKDYVVHVGDAISQLINVALLLSDNPNESISGRAYRLYDISLPWYIAYKVINTVFFLQENHCREAYFADLARAYKLIGREDGSGNN